MQEAELTRKQHVALLVLMGLFLLAIIVLAGLFLSEFWFWTVWIVLGLGGWSFRYYIQRKTPGWAIIPSAVLGASAMLYYLDRVIAEG